MSIKTVLADIFRDKAYQTALIGTDKIIFSGDVRKACKQNYCGKYNTCWTCPPAAGDIKTLEQKYKAYEWAFVFTTLHKIEDSFDIEGMDTARSEHQKIEKEAILGLKGYTVDWLGAGSCSICGKCTFPDSPCRFPDKAKSSIEACGIDVVQLAKTCNLNYNNGINTVTYFSVIFFNEGNDGSGKF
jgi:predicted metal-binding protein